MRLDFDVPKYTGEFCFCGRPILTATKKCEHNCGSKKIVIRRGKFSGKSKTPYGKYEDN